MFLIVTGYAFAFMIVEYGHDARSFSSPFKSIVRTLIMTLGEYEFNDLYKEFDKDNSIDRVFSLILLGKMIL